MDEELSLRRRVLVTLYVRYQRADRNWLRATSEAQEWLPTAPPAKLALIGDAGSRVRRLYDAREKALLQLLVAREKLEVARRRLAQQRGKHVVILLPSYF